MIRASTRDLSALCYKQILNYIIRMKTFQIVKNTMKMGTPILRHAESSRTIIEAMSTYFKIVDIEPDVHMKKTMNEINTIDSPLSWDKIASDRDQDGIKDNRKEEQ
ncbi:hypothetical protein Tco_0401257 [Tanacetum coccineum]